MNSSENVYDYDEFEYQKQKQIFNICNNVAIRERAINELHLFDYKELLYPFACATEVDKQIKNLFPRKQNSLIFSSLQITSDTLLLNS